MCTDNGLLSRLTELARYREAFEQALKCLVRRPDLREQKKNLFKNGAHKIKMFFFFTAERKGPREGSICSNERMRQIDLRPTYSSRARPARLGPGLPVTSLFHCWSRSKCILASLSSCLMHVWALAETSTIDTSAPLLIDATLPVRTARWCATVLSPSRLADLSSGCVLVVLTRHTK